MFTDLAQGIAVQPFMAQPDPLFSTGAMKPAAILDSAAVEIPSQS